MGESKRRRERGSLGDAPVEQRYREDMEFVVHALDRIFNGEARGQERKTGFILLVFPFTDADINAGRCNYISNGADRKDVVTLMREMIARFEGQPDMTGRA